ncbi:hypothetical protein ACSBR1_023735 [Camellia fascicularis]
MPSDEVSILDLTIGIGAILGADMEVVDAPALPPLIDKPFDAATYQPRTHVSSPGSISRSEGLIPGIDEYILLREPIEHLSADASTVISRSTGSYGSISGPWCWYERLPAEAHALVDVPGFGPFCSALIQMRAESLLYGALVERWWDTTESLNFSSIGELTPTPYEFLMLIGPRVGVGGPIPCDPDMT